MTIVVHLIYIILTFPDAHEENSENNEMYEDHTEAYEDHTEPSAAYDDHTHDLAAADAVSLLSLITRDDGATVSPEEANEASEEVNEYWEEYGYEQSLAA